MVKRLSTHVWKQCAADRIHWRLIMEPPQTCWPWIWRLTCHGQAPFAASVPPTIRVLGAAELSPHSEDGRKENLIFRTELHISLKIIHIFSGVVVSQPVAYQYNEVWPLWLSRLSCKRKGWGKKAFRGKWKMRLTAPCVNAITAVLR